MAHTCAGLYLKGSPIALGDGISAFQRLKRGKMLRKTAEVYVNMVYGTPSLVIYVWYDVQGWANVKVFYSKEGSRMGCPLGGVVYCFSMIPLHKELQKRHPTWFFLAQTDDVVAAPPPLTLTRSGAVSMRSMHATFRI